MSPTKNRVATLVVAALLIPAGVIAIWKLDVLVFWITTRRASLAEATGWFEKNWAQFTGNIEDVEAWMSVRDSTPTGVWVLRYPSSEMSNVEIHFRDGGRERFRRFFAPDGQQSYHAIGPEGDTPEPSKARVREPITKDWSGAQITRCDFSGMDLSGASAPEAFLHMCSFNGANLEGVQFDGGRLTILEMREATLVDGSFRGALMIGIDFSGADLKGVDFAGARLVAVDFSGAKGLSRDQLAKATLGTKTKVPVDW